MAHRKMIGYWEVDNASDDGFVATIYVVHDRAQLITGPVQAFATRKLNQYTQEMYEEVESQGFTVPSDRRINLRDLDILIVDGDEQDQFEPKDGQMVTAFKTGFTYAKNPYGESN